MHTTGDENNVCQRDGTVVGSATSYRAQGVSRLGFRLSKGIAPRIVRVKTCPAVPRIAFLTSDYLIPHILRHGKICRYGSRLPGHELSVIPHRMDRLPFVGRGCSSQETVLVFLILRGLHRLQNHHRRLLEPDLHTLQVALYPLLTLRLQIFKKLNM